jgi:hypothetical protein
LFLIQPFPLRFIIASPSLQAYLLPISQALVTILLNVEWKCIALTFSTIITGVDSTWSSTQIQGCAFRKSPAEMNLELGLPHMDPDFCSSSRIKHRHHHCILNIRLPPKYSLIGCSSIRWPSSNLFQHACPSDRRCHPHVCVSLRGTSCPHHSAESQREGDKTRQRNRLHFKPDKPF